MFDYRSVTHFFPTTLNCEVDKTIKEVYKSGFSDQLNDNSDLQRITVKEEIRIQRTVK